MEAYALLKITFVLIALILFALTNYYYTNKFTKENPSMLLAPIGLYNSPSGKEFNLFNYCVDSKGTLYSFNPLTWEIKPKDDRDILICSDNSTTRQGDVVNSLRDIKGHKVTIKRDKLNFQSLARSNGYVEIVAKPVGKRHLKIMAKSTKNLLQLRVS